MTIPILIPKGYRAGRRVLPATDTGWATYNAGSRLFLPAATNYVTNPRFIDSAANGLADGYTWLQDNHGTSVDRVVGKSNKTVMVCGDSLTEGYYAVTQADSYYAKVAARMTTLGHATEPRMYQSVAAGVEAQIATITAAAPDIFILEEGTNDVIAPTDLTAFEASLTAIVNAVYAANKNAVILMLSCWRNAPARDPYNAKIAAVATANRATYVSLSALFDDPVNMAPDGVSTWKGTSDGWHPNNAGHEAIYQLVMAALEGTDALYDDGGRCYQERVYTVAAADAAATHYFSLLCGFPAGIGIEDSIASFEYQLIASDARSLSPCSYRIYNAALSETDVAALPPVSTWTPGTIASAWAAAPGAGRLLAYVYLNAATLVAGDTITLRIRRLNLVPASVVAPYFDGSYPNCAWTGTANASTSTRTASDLRFSIGSYYGEDGVGTIAARIVPLWANVDGVDHELVEFYQAAATPQRSYGLHHYGGNGLSTLTFNGVTLKWEIYAGAFSAGVSVVAVSRHSDANLDLNVDGNDVAQAAGGSLPAGLDTLLVGTFSSVSSVGAYAYIGPVIASSTRKSDAWVAAIQANGGAAYNNLNVLWNTYMSPGDMLIPLKENGYGWVKR